MAKWKTPPTGSSTVELIFLSKQPQIRGAFPFLWGAKHEQTATWHGLLLADGSATAMSDALAAAWGRPVAAPAPVVRGIGIGAAGGADVGRLAPAEHRRVARGAG